MYIKNNLKKYIILCLTFLFSLFTVYVYNINTTYASKQNIELKQNIENINIKRNNNNSDDINNPDIDILTYDKDMCDKYRSVYLDKEITYIFNNIVKANHNKLQLKDNTNGIGVAPVKVIKTDHSIESQYANAYSFYYTGENNNYIYITDSYIHKAKIMDIIYANNVGQKFDIHSFEKKDIYLNSELASILAHELGHYYDRVILKHELNDNNSRAEDFADNMASFFLGNTFEYSYGSNISDLEHSADSKFNYQENYSTGTDETHENNISRINNALQFITNVSKGKVKIDYINNVHKNLGYGIYTVNNIPIIVPDYSYHHNCTPGGYRANYSAGQVAWAIEHNLWDGNNLRIVTLSEIYPEYKNVRELCDKSVLILINNNSEINHLIKFKIIDIFETDKDLLLKRLDEVVNNKATFKFKTYRDYWTYLKGYKDGGFYNYLFEHDTYQTNEACGSYLEAQYLSKLMLSSV